MGYEIPRMRPAETREISMALDYEEILGIKGDRLYRSIEGLPDQTGRGKNISRCGS